MTSGVLLVLSSVSSLLSCIMSAGAWTEFFGKKDLYLWPCYSAGLSIWSFFFSLWQILKAKCKSFWWMQWSFLAEISAFFGRWVSHFKKTTTALKWILVTFIVAIYCYFALDESVSFIQLGPQQNQFLNVCISIKLFRSLYLSQPECYITNYGLFNGH